jgi:hypothetical protein
LCNESPGQTVDSPGLAHTCCPDCLSVWLPYCSQAPGFLIVVFASFALCITDYPLVLLIPHLVYISSCGFAVVTDSPQIALAPNCEACFLPELCHCRRMGELFMGSSWQVKWLSLLCWNVAGGHRGLELEALSLSPGVAARASHVSLTHRGLQGVPRVLGEHH